MWRSVLLLTFIANSVLPVPVQGEALPSGRAAENRALVQRLVLDRAAAVASVQRIADEREEQLFAELAAKDQRLRAEQRTRKAAQGELAKVTAERQRLVDEIATRNRQFAAEIEEYRRQVASIADSPDPRKRGALKRYAEGHRAEGYADLVEIQEAETKAVAAGWREIAALAQDRKDRGEIGTAEAIKPYEKAQAMDADYVWGWIELRRLYQEAGRLPDARRAAEQALTHAQNDRDRAVAESELGDVLEATGDLAGARKRFEENLKIAEQMAQADPANAHAQRDLSISFNRLGKVLDKAGDLRGARARLEQALAIDEELAKTNRASTEAKRDFGVSLEKLGDLLVKMDDQENARKRFEQALEIRELSAKTNPTSVAAQRDLGISLNRLGKVLLETGDLPGAGKRYQQCLDIVEKLAKANPTSAIAQRDFGISLSRLGEVFVKEGDLARARKNFEQALKIADQLVKADPTSADEQGYLCISLESLGDVLLLMHDLAGARERFTQALKITMNLAAVNPTSAEIQYLLFSLQARLGGLPGGESHLREALRIALDLQSQGRLPQRYGPIIEYLQKQIAATEKAKP
jgi:tetratricopeptide (TPR) repeat protein